MPGLPGDIVIVSGTAAIELAPDQVSFDISIAHEGPQIRPLVEQHNAVVARVVAALKSNGIQSRELKTSAFRLGAIERDDKPAGFSARTEIGVTEDDTSKAAEWIAAALDAGATGIDGPQFSVRNEKSVQDRCIDAAFADGRQKAERLARLSLRRLGKVLAVTDGSSSPFELKYRSGVEGGTLGGMLFEPGMHTIECGVTIAFALVD